jgi:hypothetical protein
MFRPRADPFRRAQDGLLTPCDALRTVPSRHACADIPRTPAGVGWSAQPRTLLKDGDEFRVYLSHGVGTLINKIEEEK